VTPALVLAGAMQDLRAWLRFVRSRAGTGRAPSAGMPQRTSRYILGALLGLLALDALASSALSSYSAPGLTLFVLVGGAAAIAAVAVLARHQRGFALAKLAGWILVTWLIAQVVVIGLVSWLQPVMVAAAIAILMLAYHPERLPPAWRTP
jgi:hypothetical protein